MHQLDVVCPKDTKVSSAMKAHLISIFIHSVSERDPVSHGIHTMKLNIALRNLTFAIATCAKIASNYCTSDFPQKALQSHHESWQIVAKFWRHGFGTKMHFVPVMN